VLLRLERSSHSRRFSDALDLSCYGNRRRIVTHPELRWLVNASKWDSEYPYCHGLIIMMFRTGKGSI